MPHRANAKSRLASPLAHARYCCPPAPPLLLAATNTFQREPLATTFKCVFCNNDASVTVRIDKKAGIGSLNCKQCLQNYQVPTNLGSPSNTTTFSPRTYADSAFYRSQPSGRRIL